MQESNFGLWFEHVSLQGTVALACMILLTSFCILAGYGLVLLVEWCMRGGKGGENGQ